MYFVRDKILSKKVTPFANSLFKDFLLLNNLSVFLSYGLKQEGIQLNSSTVIGKESIKWTTSL